MANHKVGGNRFQGKNPDPGPVFYEIEVQGRLDPQRSGWFEGMTLTPSENDESGLACTRIAGPVIDQPALHGLLTKIRDLNLTLISLRRVLHQERTVQEGPDAPG